MVGEYAVMGDCDGSIEGGRRRAAKNGMGGFHWARRLVHTASQIWRMEWMARL